MIGFGGCAAHQQHRDRGGTNDLFGIAAQQHPPNAAPAVGAEHDHVGAPGLHLLKHVGGAFLAFMRGILNSDACIRRGLYERAYVEKLLAAPEAWFTRIQGSKLWHLALLALWLQLNVDAPCCSATSTGPSQARTETS